MTPLGLSPEALDRRRKYITASDAARIMAGDWNALWREKTGLDEPVDLSGVLPVQLGSFTEPFNLAWCQQQTGRPVDYYSDNDLLIQIWMGLTGCWRSEVRDEFVVSNTYPWMAASLDGVTTTARGERCVIDAKHVGRSDDPMIMRYTAAGTHQATVCGFDWWALSVLVGNSKWELIEQPVDPLYQAELIERTREFYEKHLVGGAEPEDRVDAAATPRPVPRLRTVNLIDASHEAWPNWGDLMVLHIEQFARTEPAFKSHQAARSDILKLLPEDVGTVTRGLFSLKRDKAGKVRMSMGKPESDDE